MSNNFKWHAISLLVLPLMIGIGLGIFFQSTIDDKYLMALIGFLGAIFAYLGIMYSKEKELQLKKLEFQNQQEVERRALLVLKKEELYHEFIELYAYISERLPLYKLCIQDSRELLKTCVEAGNRIKRHIVKLRSYSMLYGIVHLEDINEVDNLVRKLLLAILKNPDIPELTTESDLGPYDRKEFENIYKDILDKIDEILTSVKNVEYFLIKSP